MSDYCKDCSQQLFGKDFRELAGLVTKEEVEKGFGASVICECCGYIWVDHEGQIIRVSDCEGGEGCYHGIGCHKNKKR